MQIIIDTTAPLTETDLAVLRVLISGEALPAPTVGQLTLDLTTPKAAAPAKRSPKAAVVASPESAPSAATPAGPEEDIVVEDDEDDDTEDAGVYTLQDAVSKATELVAAGKAAAVKKALTSVGAKRVSELKGDAISSFMNALA